MIASRESRMGGDGKSAVWLLRFYKETRSSGKGIMTFLIGIPGYAWTSAWNWVMLTWQESVQSALRTRQKVSLGKRVLLTLSLPLVFVLFLLQCVLKLASSIIITIFLMFTMLVLALLWVLAKIIRFVLYFPMQLFEHGFKAFRGAYAIVLRQILHFSPIVILAVLALSFHAGQQSLKLGRELIPPMKQGEFSIRVESKPGTRLEDTEARAMDVERIVRGFSLVDTVTLQVGSDQQGNSTGEGENVAVLTVKLKNPEQNVQIQDELIERIRKEVQSRIAEQVTFELPTLFSFKTAMEIQIYGEELEQLRYLGENVVASIHDVEGLKDVELSLKQGYPEIHITLDRELLNTKNLQPFQVAQLLRTEVQGDIATRFNRGGEKVDIRVRSDKQHLTSLDDLRMLSVLDGNPPTPLSSVAEITIQEGPSEIRRIDQRQVVLVTANVEGRDLGSVAREIEERIANVPFPEGYTYLLGGQNRELETSYGGLIFAMALAVFLVYVVMACQFESIWHPALIMFSVPMAFIGVIYVLQFFNISVSIVVFIGGIVLAGIIVNAAIVLVDYINQLRARGLAKSDAIVQACTIRFRPIMMTTMTTVLGLLPMALSTGEGAEIRGPMAITVIAGLLSGTLLTLFIIPVVYQFFGGRDKV